MEFGFQFDAPKWANFFARPALSRSHIAIDPSDQNDKWFLGSNILETPEKEIQAESVCLPVAIKRDVRFANEPEHPVAKVTTKRMSKRASKTKKTTPASSRQASTSQHRQIQLKKEQPKPKAEQIKPKTKVTKITPCPFPLKIQREWEGISKRPWSSLSRDSIVRAKSAMKSLIKKKAKSVGKKGNFPAEKNQRGRFKF